MAYYEDNIAHTVESPSHPQSQDRSTFETLITCWVVDHCLATGHSMSLGNIYTAKGGLSSKCEEFLAMWSQFDSDHGVDFSAPTCCQCATFVRPLFAFYCPLFFTNK